MEIPDLFGSTTGEEQVILLHSFRKHNLDQSRSSSLRCIYKLMVVRHDIGLESVTL
jgi:hypothetical protein